MKPARRSQIKNLLVKTIIIAGAIGLLTGIILTFTSGKKPVVTYTPPTQNYPRPTSWKTISLTDYKLSICLPPKWETTARGHIIFNRDANYQPGVADIKELTYNGESIKEEYLKQKLQYEQDNAKLITQTVIKEMNFNNFPVLLIKIPTFPEAYVFTLNNKLYEASLYSWNLVNDSHDAFLKDIYTMLGCVKSIEK